MAKTTNYAKLFRSYAFPSYWGDSTGPMGLSKRELFAAMAMQGLLGDSELKASWEKFATMSVECADALLAELEKEKENPDARKKNPPWNLKVPLL